MNKMIIRYCLTHLLSTLLVLGFSGVFKECWTQEDFDSPQILVHPKPTEVLVAQGNESIQLMCLAIGNNVTYTWEKANSILPNKAIGQDSNILTLPELRMSDTGNYRCRVSNAQGTVFSQYAYLSVTEFLQARVEPQNLTLEVTTSASLSCIVDGFELENVSYMWRVTQIKDGEELMYQLQNATTPLLLLNNITASVAYQCIATNGSGVVATSAFSYITVVVHPPKIIVHPVSKSVELQNSTGDFNISFTCTATGYSSHFQWERLQGALPVNAQGRTTNTLTVYNVQPEDSGYYRCSVSNNSGTAYSNYATLNITVRPPAITAAYINQSLCHTGDAVMFVCRGEGYGRLQFKWQRQIGNISSSAVADVNNGTLIIPKVLLGDRGSYRCIVCDDWNGTVYSEYVQLDVSRRPLVTNTDPQSIVTRQKSNVSFSCVITDSLVNATFLWTRVDGVPLSNRVRGSNTSILTIIGVTKGDEGEYMCTANGESQTVTSNVVLTVYNIPVVHLQSKHTAEVSSRLLMTCTARNDPRSPHPLEIAWYRGDNQLNNTQDGRYEISYLRNTLNNVTIALLTISQIQKDDAGQYGCRVQPGDVSSETTVTVNYKPEIVTFKALPSNNVMLNEAIQILCHVDANPLPRITMSRNNVALFNTNRRVVEYTIQRVSADLNGTVFSCRAENSVGSILQHVTLFVAGIPDILPSTTTINLAPSTAVIPSIVAVTPTPQPAAVPVNVKQVSQRLTSLQVQWNVVPQDQLLFHIRIYCVAVCIDNVVKNFTTMDTTITVYGLQPDHVYAVQVAAETNSGVLSRYTEPLQVSTVTTDGASVKQAVVTNRRLRVSTLQWSINKNLSQDILHYEIQLNNSQDVIIVNSSTVTLPAKPNEGSSVNIIAVYRLNGSEVTWRSEAVMVMIKPFVPSNDNSVLFQLQLETACDEWESKLDAMTDAIMNAISEHCACNLSIMDVFNDRISCNDHGDVIYRAGLGSSMQLDAGEISILLSKWGMETSALAVDGSLLQVDQNCPLILSSFDDPACGATNNNIPKSSTSSSNIVPLLVGVLSGVIIGAVVITVVVLVLVFKYRGKTDKIRPDGSTPTNSSLDTMQTRSARRKTQANEEATYSEVFNNLPPCPVQPCPAYEASVHLDHDYVDIEDRNNTTTTSVHVFAGRPEPVQSSNGRNHLHNELELSTCSSSSGRIDINDYSEPMMLSQRLDSKASRQLPVQKATKSCSDYIEPVGHNSDDSNSRSNDYQDITESQFSSHHNRRHQQQVPCDYLEPVSSAKQPQENGNLRSKQQNQIPHISSSTNTYSEPITANYNNVSD